MSRPVTPASRLRPHPRVVSRRIAGEQILVPVRGDAAQMDYLFTANTAGSSILGWLDGSRDVSQIAALLAKEFEVDEERALRDAVAFLETLLDAGLALPVGEEP